MNNHQGGAEKMNGTVDTKETTVIRISNKNYEYLRREAFEKRTTIRQIADEILEDELKNKKIIFRKETTN